MINGTYRVSSIKPIHQEDGSDFVLVTLTPLLRDRSSPDFITCLYTSPHEVIVMVGDELNIQTPR